MRTQNESAYSNPDPAADSQSAALVAQHLPYMVATYARPPPVFVKGDGCYLFDIENNRYVDFTAGIAVNGLGHNDVRMNQLMVAQAQQLIHVSNLYHNPWTGELSQLLVERTKASGGFHNAARVFICNSGSEANEAAIKFARKVGKTVGGDKKIGVVSFQGSFHGRTMGSLSATPNPKYQKPFGPMVPGFTYGKFNDVEGIDALVTEETCGVIVEPIQGEGGVWIGSEEFLTKLRARCTEVGAVLIYDEIQVSNPRHMARHFEHTLTRTVRNRTYRRALGPPGPPQGGAPRHCHHGQGSGQRLPHWSHDGERVGGREDCHWRPRHHLWR